MPLLIVDCGLWIAGIVDWGIVDWRIADYRLPIGHWRLLIADWIADWIADCRLSAP
jgi:hypothetical protein